MPPEMLSEDYFSHEGDIWALGCMAYEMYYGKHPFQESNEGLTWKKILNENP